MSHRAQKLQQKPHSAVWAVYLKAPAKFGKVSLSFQTRGRSKKADSFSGERKTVWRMKNGLKSEIWKWVLYGMVQKRLLSLKVLTPVHFNMQLNVFHPSILFFWFSFLVTNCYRCEFCPITAQCEGAFAGLDAESGAQMQAPRYKWPLLILQSGAVLRPHVDWIRGA